MPIDQVAKSLWTPDGPVDLREKDVTIISDPRERMLFIGFHEVAFRHTISVVCPRCDSAITGQNNDSGQVWAVACRCREWRFVR